MSRYIKREDAIKRLCDFSQEGTIPMPYELWENVLRAVPSADVVEVVRCKDCRYWHPDINLCTHWGKLDDEDILPHAYCSFGERKDGDKE